MTSSTGVDSRLTGAVFGGCAVLGLSLILAKNPMNTLAKNAIEGMYKEGKAFLEKTLYDSPVIALSGVISLGINQVLSKWAPGLSPLAGYVGSLKVAQLVGTAFLLKSTLDPFLERVIQEQQQEEDKYLKIHHAALRYLVPLTISIVALRSYGSPVKSIPGALFTMCIFYGMNLLNRAYYRTIDTIWEALY